MDGSAAELRFAELRAHRFQVNQPMSVLGGDGPHTYQIMIDDIWIKGGQHALASNLLAHGFESRRFRWSRRVLLQEYHISLVLENLLKVGLQANTIQTAEN